MADTTEELMRATINERRKERLRDLDFGELLDLLPEESRARIRKEMEEEIMSNFLDDFKEEMR